MVRVQGREGVISVHTNARFVVAEAASELNRIFTRLRPSIFHATVTRPSANHSPTQPNADSPNCALPHSTPNAELVFLPVNSPQARDMDQGGCGVREQGSRIACGGGDAGAAV
ncbi:hypothetical protein BV22DRAFT_1135766 [Leucogyrophana mollusca]|uniref:Uncharacterized protein n=1 Tax=Leucogyrophana mollusca TaxID=85980 RepID=A0ACB8AW10_9AGAM|nr:hypothetical protein BV22DRAFT_1135766 [Leucogyrophana mollusca]